MTAQPYIDDYAGDASTTGQIAAGQARTGEIAPFDHDWFRINFTEGETYTFHLRGQDSGSGTLPDPFLALLDADGNTIAANDDWDSLDSQIVYTAAATGTYFLDAQGLGSNIGTYELSVDPLLV